MTKAKKRKAREFWIIFRRFSSDVLEVHPSDTAKYISDKFQVVNPRCNLIKVREVTKRGKAK